MSQALREQVERQDALNRQLAERLERLEDLAHRIEQEHTQCEERQLKKQTSFFNVFSLKGVSTQ